MSHDDYRQQLLRDLEGLFEYLSGLSVLSGLFDSAWKDHVANEISRADLADAFSSQHGPFFFLFKDVDRRPLLRTLDDRLASLLRFGTKRQEIKRKLREIQGCLFSRKQLQHFFELSTLGFFAQMDSLVDLEVLVGRSSVDGLIRLGTRQVLIEVTLTTQELLARGPGVFSMAVEELTGQVERKVIKKAASGKQLALAKGQPAILILGLDPFGADQLAAEWALQDLFAREQSPTLSAVVVSDSWMFLASTLHLNPRGNAPLLDSEVEVLQHCIARATSVPP